MFKRIFSYLTKRRLNKLDKTKSQEDKITKEFFICGTPEINFASSQKSSQRKPR